MNSKNACTGHAGNYRYLVIKKKTPAQIYNNVIKYNKQKTKRSQNHSKDSNHAQILDDTKPGKEEERWRAKAYKNRQNMMVKIRLSWLVPIKYADNNDC